jgi:small-conductance mechanosensitive channel
MIIVLTIALLLCTSFSVLAQEGNPIGNPVDAPAGFNSPEGNPVDGYPVVLNGQTLFRVRQGVPGVVSAAERAKIVQARIEAIANNPAIDLSTIRIDEKESVSVVEAGDIVLFTVQDSDKVADLSRQQTAEKAVRLIQSNVAEYRDARSARRLIQGMILALLSTITLIGFLILLQRLLARLLIKIRAARRADRLDIRLQNFQLLGSDATSYLLNGFLQFLRLVLVLGSLYLYIPFVLSQFPATRVIGESILSDIAHRTNQLVTVFVAYLPSLVMIGIIAFLTYYIIGFAKLVITELGRDDAFPWFYPEWIQPTIRLATFLIIAIACVVAGPYLPGFGSPAFQGVSLFLGALLTLGSSSAVANAISGVILIYTRAFRIGDIIRLGEITGEVEEKSLFVTRVVTFKKEVITIPNASVLSSNVVNFNAVLRESSGYLLLHTTITLGYDVSWRKIHDTLIQAAEATSGIVATPRPFVLQTALNDYNVSYELNAYSNCPHLMPKVYSDLHQNIQDYCNQAGIEILSPAYSSIRDGNHSTIPADYLPDDYMSPTFQVQNRNHQS